MTFYGPGNAHTSRARTPFSRSSSSDPHDPERRRMRQLQLHARTRPILVPHMYAKRLRSSLHNGLAAQAHHLMSNSIKPTQANKQT
jgi:hypothetical protein